MKVPEMAEFTDVKGAPRYREPLTGYAKCKLSKCPQTEPKPVWVERNHQPKRVDLPSPEELCVLVLSFADDIGVP